MKQGLYSVFPLPRDVLGAEEMINKYLMNERMNVLSFLKYYIQGSGGYIDEFLKYVGKE